MRGCDGNLSGWNGSHGSEDSARGYCMIRKVGAYVVNSENVTSGCNGDFQRGPGYPLLSTVHRPNQVGFPENCHQLSMISRECAVTQFPHQGYPYIMKRVEETILYERPRDVVDHVNYQNTHLGNNQSSEATWRNSYETLGSSGKDNHLGNSFSSSNIYEGTMVRVQVPEAFPHQQNCPESGIRRNSGTAVAYSQGRSYQVGQHLSHSDTIEDHNNHEIYDSSVSVETYRRITDWLNNCQVHPSNNGRKTSSSGNTQPSNPSFGLKQQGPGNDVHQSTVSKYANQGNRQLKVGCTVSNKTGAISDLKYQKPQVAAGMEPRVAKKGGTVNHQQRNTDAHLHKSNNGHSPNREKPTYASKTVNITSGFSYNNNHMPSLGKSYLGSELSKTSSEWSSETLSFLDDDDDIGSYCTDFTPFEFGQRSLHRSNNIQTSASDCPTAYGKNAFVSHVTVNGQKQQKNDLAREELSETVQKTFEKALVNEKWNRKHTHLTRNADTESKTNQHIKLHNTPAMQKLRNLQSFESNSNTSKAHVATIVITAPQQEFKEQNYHNLETRNHKEPTLVKPLPRPRTSKEVQQNLKVTEVKMSRDERNASYVQGETKPYRETRLISVSAYDTKIEKKDRKLLLESYEHETSMHRLERMPRKGQNEEISHKEEGKAPLVLCKIKVQNDGRLSLVPNRTTVNRPLSVPKLIAKEQPSYVAPKNDVKRSTENQNNCTIQKNLESGMAGQARYGSLAITIRPSRPSVIDYFQDIETVPNSPNIGNEEPPSDKESFEEIDDYYSDDDNDYCDGDHHDNGDHHDDGHYDSGHDDEGYAAFNNAQILESRDFKKVVDASSSASSVVVSDAPEDAFTKSVIKADLPGRAPPCSSRSKLSAKPQYSFLRQTSLFRTDKSASIFGDMRTSEDCPNDEKLKKHTNCDDSLAGVTEYSNSANQKQVHNSYSSTILSSEGVSHYRNEICDVDNEAERYCSTDKKENSDTVSAVKCSKLLVSLNQNNNNNSCPESHSFMKTLPNLQRFNETCIVSNDCSNREEKGYKLESSNHISPISDKRKMSFVDEATPYENDNLRSSSTEEMKECITDDELHSEDSLLMSIMKTLKSKSIDLPEFDDFSVPQLKSQNFVRTSHFTIIGSSGKCLNDSEYKKPANSELEVVYAVKPPVRDSVDMPMKPFANCSNETSALASNVIIELPGLLGADLSHKKEERSLRFPSSPVSNSSIMLEFTAERHKECDRNRLQTHSEMLQISSDNEYLSGSEVEKRKGMADTDKQTTAFMAHGSANINLPSNEHPATICEDTCEKSSIKYYNKTNVKEPLSCQEFIEFPGGLDIAPPESFSDFSIIL